MLGLRLVSGSSRGHSKGADVLLGLRLASGSSKGHSKGPDVLLRLRLASGSGMDEARDWGRVKVTVRFRIELSWVLLLQWFLQGGR